MHTERAARKTSEFGIKVVAAIVAMVTFLGTLETLKPAMTPALRQYVSRANGLSVLCVGVAYTACSDIYATIVAYMVAFSILQLHRPALVGGMQTLGFSFAGLVGLGATEAVAWARSQAPAMDVQLVAFFASDARNDRLQLLAGADGKIVDYRQG